MNNTYRTIWISDLHLGSTQCQADVLLDFLKHNESEMLYLVGDIIDFWSLSRKMYWPTDHNTVIQKILRKARHGTHVVYIPGNHGDNVWEYDKYVFGDITVKKSDVHTSASGKKFLIVHGDEYDTIAQCHKWIARIGSDGYDFLIWVNRFLRIIRKWLGIQSNFSLAAYVKFKVKNAVQFISDYEDSIVNTLKDQNLDGVIWGHIHHAEIKDIDSFLYINTGDFVESCTAIVEHTDGTIELIKWNISESMPVVDKTSEENAQSLTNWSRFMHRFTNEPFYSISFLSEMTMPTPTTPLLTADAIIELTNTPGRPIVLIERANPPFGWAIPGGFVDVGVIIEQAAVREAQEESQLGIRLTALLGIYSDPARDNRRHTVTAVYIAEAKGIPVAADDAKNCQVFNLDKLPSPLAFDHAQVLSDYKKYRETGHVTSLNI